MPFSDIILLRDQNYSLSFCLYVHCILMVFDCSVCPVSAVGLFDNRYFTQSQAMAKIFLVRIRLIWTLSYWYLVANTTRETVSFSLLVATTFIHADVAMMRWLTILWIGIKSVSYILLSPYKVLRFSILFITFSTSSDMYTGNLLQRWCAWNAWKFSQLGLHAPLFPAIIFPWQDIIAISARYLMMKGDVAWLTSFTILI